MDSAEELNILAVNLRTEGDAESIKKLAAENGLDPEEAEDFIAGDINELCNTISAAIGKLDAEAKELKCKDLMADWVDWIKAECVKDKELAAAVRRKEKNLAGALGAVLKLAWSSKSNIDKRIKEAAGISAKVQFGVPGSGTLRKTIREYYGGVR